MTRQHFTSFSSIGASYSIRGARKLLYASFVWSLAFAGAVAHAGPISGSYALSAGESARLLEAELQHSRGEISIDQLNAISQEESCKNPSARLHDRNRVALMLQNTSPMENQLSSFTIDLTELGYEFGGGDLPGDGFNGSLVMQSERSDPGVNVFATYGTTSGSTDRTKLELSFSGLSTNQAVIFRIDLDPVPATGALYPDYRGIMAGGNMGSGPTDPALISATFSADGMEASTPMTPFAPNIEGMIETSGQLEAYHRQAPSRMYGQTGTTEVDPVPEPSTAVLFLASATWLLSLRMRRTNRLRL